jgi:hypothetical protein
MQGINSPLFIFHAAKEYFENGTCYASKYFKKDTSGLLVPFDSLTHAKLCVPATNISFSLELAFKGLLQLSSGITRGHDLEKLYRLLNVDIRNKIFDHYQSHDVYQKYITIRLGNGIGHGTTQIIPRPVSEKDFLESIIATQRLAFVDFRYLFEFPADGEFFFYFKEFSNYAFSALSIFGEMLGLKVESVSTKNAVPKK